MKEENMGLYDDLSMTRELKEITYTNTNDVYRGLKFKVKVINLSPS